MSKTVKESDAPHTPHAMVSGLLSVPQTAQIIGRILSQRYAAEKWQLRSVRLSI